MQLRKIQDTDLTNKNVLMRVDFNVSVQDGVVQDMFRIKAAKKSIEHIRNCKGARLALITHLGRPKGKDESLSLKNIIDTVEDVLEFRPVFVDRCVGASVNQALEELPEGGVLLLENVRFEPGETENDMEFSRCLAEPFDVFVNDAFSVCHRDQASVTGVAELLPAIAGLHVQEEVKQLSRVQTAPEHPAVAIIGGAKIETKLPLIQQFENTYDAVLIGGKIANEALDRKVVFSEKVVLPTDFVQDRMDIGPETVNMFIQKTHGAKTIVWNGPLGKFEDVEFSRGTEAIAHAVADSNAFTLVGGGESVQALGQFNLMDKVSFVSTGGGAMLSFLGGEEMPGLRVLEEV